jgi:hypothetical protein
MNELPSCRGCVYCSHGDMRSRRRPPRRRRGATRRSAARCSAARRSAARLLPLCALIGPVSAAAAAASTAAAAAARMTAARAAAATTTPSSTPSTAPRAVLPAVVATILTAAAAAVAAAARATTATTNPHTRWHAAAQVLDKLSRAATARRLRAGVPPRDQVDQDRVAQVLQVLRRAGMRDEKEGRAGEGRSVP